MRSALLLLLAASPSIAQERNVSGGPLRADQACYDVLRYGLRVVVDPARKRIDGVLTMRARRIGAGERIALDLDPALALGAVKVDGAAVAAERADGRFTVPVAAAVGSEFAVEVAYGGVPREARNPPWDGGFTWSQTKDGKPWIATSCQGEGADLWWPCKDHPSDKPDTFDLHITVPEGLVVASNGVLTKDEKGKDGRRTFHWHVASPISNYCIALGIAPYEIVSDTYTSIDGTKVPVQFFALPQNVEKAKKILPQFLDHVRVFEEMLGPYPFRAEKYGICETPHLGMEHQTIIAYGNGYRDMRYDWLHNHELSHEWWGNLVTCRDWKDMWIHESFGTYMQPLYLEKRQGRKAYQIEMKKDARFVNQIALAPRQSMDSQEIYFQNGGSNDIYYKGCWVLHTLRWQMGDEKFFESLRRFCYPTEALRKATDGSQCRLVDTDDYVKLCNEIAGEDLSWFFEVYVRQPKLPVLRSELKDGVLSLEWQVPEGLVLQTPVPVEVGGKLVRVPMLGGKGTCKVGANEYRVDPDALVLMQRD